MERNIIFLESCMDTMRRLPDQSIGLVITSPPYNLLGKVSKGKIVRRTPSSATGISHKYAEFDDYLDPEEYYKFHSATIKEMLRISQQVAYNVMITTGSKSSVFRILGEYADYVKDIIIWSKPNPQPAMGVGVLNRGSELIIMLDSVAPVGRKFTTFNFDRGTLNDVWTDIKSNKQFTGTHSAGMPLDLAIKLIERFSTPEMVIYDPFMGTGTTAVASIMTGRDWIGSEISAQYYSLAMDRINKYKEDNGI